MSWSSCSNPLAEHGKESWGGCRRPPGVAVASVEGNGNRAFQLRVDAEDDVVVFVDSQRGVGLVAQNCEEQARGRIVCRDGDPHAFGLLTLEGVCTTKENENIVGIALLDVASQTAIGPPRARLTRVS